jgi:hypothetical protein
MENQFVNLQVPEFPSLEKIADLEELVDLQFRVVGGGCVEYCPY